MSQLVSDLSREQTLTQKDLESFWGRPTDPYSLWNIISPVLSNLHTAYEKGEIPKVNWSLGGSFVTNTYIAPVFRKVHDKDVKLVFVVPSEEKVDVFHRIKAVVENSLQFLPQDRFRVGKLSYSMQDQDLSFSVCRISHLGESQDLPLEITIQLISHPNVRLHVLNLDSAEVVGPDILPADELATFTLRSKETKKDGSLAPVLTDIRNHIISSSASLENSFSYSRGEWPRYLFALTDGAVEKDENTNLNFFLGAQSVGKNMPNLVRHWIGQKREGIPNYECYTILNALMHCISPRERADILLRHLEENPQAFHVWIQKKLYILRRLESQIKQIQKQLHWGGQRRGVLANYDDYTLLNSLIQSIDPSSRVLDLNQNSQMLMNWIEGNPHILASLKESFSRLKAGIEQFETDGDLSYFLKFMKEEFPPLFMQFLEGEDVRPYFVSHLKALLQDPSLNEQIQGTWILFLRKWAQIPMNDSAFLEGIKRFAPLFAEQVVLKKHLHKVYLQCKFQQGEEPFYFLIPLFNSEEIKKFTMISEKQDLVLSNPMDKQLQQSPLFHFLSDDPSSLAIVLQEKKCAQDILEVSLDSDISQFANKVVLSQMLNLEQADALIPLTDFQGEQEILSTISFLFKLCKAQRLEDFENSFFPLFYPLFSRLSLENQRKVARELIRQICSAYPNSSFSASLSQKLRQMIFSAKIDEEEKKPWQALYISLILSSSMQDIERSRLFLTMEKTLSPLNLSRFPKLLPNQQSVSIYFMKQFVELQTIAPEKACSFLHTALREKNLLVHVKEIEPFLKEMVDPRCLDLVFQKLNQAREYERALHLLALKGTLFGHLDCIPQYVSLYEQSIGVIKSTIETTCLSLIENLLKTSSSSDVLKLYKYCVSMPVVAKALEQHPSLSAKDIQAFICTLNPAEKQEYLSACLSRLPHMPGKEARKVCHYLNSLGMQQHDLETVFLNLYKQDERFGAVILSDFPHLIEPLLARLNTAQDKLGYYNLLFTLASYGHRYAWNQRRDSFVNDFRFLANQYGKNAVVDLIKRYLTIASIEEKSFLAFACAAISPSSETSITGFHAVVTDDFPITLWKSQSWTPKLMQSTWHLMKGKSRQQIEDFVELSMEVIPHSKEFKLLWQEMSPYMTRSSESVFVNRVIDQCSEIYKHAKQEDLASYFSFLIFCPEFSSYLNRNPALHEAFLHLFSKYVTSPKKDRDYEKNLTALINLLGKSQVIEPSLEGRQKIEKEKIRLAFSSLQELKKRNAPCHKIDLKWIVECAIESLNPSEIRDLLEENAQSFPELSIQFLHSVIPHLDATKDQEQTLVILHKLLSSVSTLSGSILITLSNYLLEMNLRCHASDVVFLCSEALISLASMNQQNEVVEELIENIHRKRLEEAVRCADDRKVLSELTALCPFLYNENNIACVNQMMASIGSYALERLNADVRFLDVFQSFDVPELSIFALDLLKMYRTQPQGQYRQMPLDELSYHVKKIAKLPVERIPYHYLRDLADYFLGTYNAEIYVTANREAQEGGEGSARWEKYLADERLSLLSKELITVFLLRREMQDVRRIEKLIECIHIDRLKWCTHLNADSILVDMQAYCTYLENVISHENRSELLRSVYLLAVLKKIKNYSLPQATYFINRILEISFNFCSQGPKSFMGFCLSLGSLDMMTSNELRDLIPLRFKLQITSLVEFAYNCNWEGIGATYFLERLQAVASMFPASLTDEMVEKSFRKACREIDTLQSNPKQYIDLCVFIIRMIVNILKLNSRSKLSRDLKTILMQTLFKLQQISLGTSIVILSEVAEAIASHNLREEFQQYCQKMQNQRKKEEK